MRAKNNSSIGLSQAILFGIVLAVAILGLAGPIQVEAAEGPDCKLTEVINQQGQTCWACVVGGEAAECVCGGYLCFE